VKEATTTVARRRKMAQGRCKRKIYENPKAEESYKFKEDPIIEKKNFGNGGKEATMYK